MLDLEELFFCFHEDVGQWRNVLFGLAVTCNRILLLRHGIRCGNIRGLKKG